MHAPGCKCSMWCRLKDLRAKQAEQDAKEREERRRNAKRAPR